jgi:putative transposase
VRVAIEQAVEEELEAALGARAYERDQGRRGYRNGHRARTLSGPTGPVVLTVPRGTLFTQSGECEWSSSLLPRYQRRMSEANQAIVATYLSGDNTRRNKGALRPLLKATPLSKSAVSRVVSTMQDELAAWRTRSLSA